MADYSPRKNVRLEVVKITEEHLAGAKERFVTSEALVETYGELGWPTNPSQRECEHCPIKCNDRFNEKTES